MCIDKINTPTQDFITDLDDALVFVTILARQMITNNDDGDSTKVRRLVTASAWNTYPFNINTQALVIFQC
jgi:hypothetical protein